MSTVAMVGVGKLGLPVSVVIALKGHTVLAYDADASKLEKYRSGVPDTGSYEPHLEEQLHEALQTGGLRFCESLADMWAGEPEIIFVAVPTPSKDDDSFDTSCVEDVLTELDKMHTSGYSPVVVVISTVLPMTTRTRFAPLTRLPIVYNPYFIAMGTVVEDYLAPEFVLLGYGDENQRVKDIITDFYQSIYEGESIQPPLLHMTWENAEATKVLYNTIIGFKIIIGNTIMEMCHHIPHADCDTIVNAFKYATKRIVGTKYLKGGMGDGGECHPRDNRALSYLCEQLRLSANPFDFIMESRSYQCGWLAYLMSRHGLPAVILGKRFKANTNLTTDSASIEVAQTARNLGVEVHYHDPVLGLEYYPKKPHVFLVAIDEMWTRNYPYPSGSVVLDVWRQFEASDVENLKLNNVTYIPVGRGVVDSG